jgi:isoquinoline 1-oxidoreductase beta subunit
MRVGRSDGNVDAALARAIKRIEADYEVPFLAHATMEPQNCTARVTADLVEIWVPTQDGETALAVAATPRACRPASRGSQDNARMRLRRRGIFQEFVRQAVLIAKEAGQPVKPVWTREEDTRHDFYRPWRPPG